MRGGNRGAEYVNGRIRILIGEPEPDSFVERARTLLIVTLHVKDLGAMSFLVNSLALLVNSIASRCSSGIWKGLSEGFVETICPRMDSKKRVTRLPLDSLELLTGDFDIELSN